MHHACRWQGDRQQLPCHPDNKKLVVADANRDGHYSSEELGTLTETQIRTLAERLEYSISGSTKADLITSFLSAQSTAEAAHIAAADANNDESYSEAELKTLTVAEIKALAESLSYTITGSSKNALIASFLEAQTAAAQTDGDG